MTAIDSYLAKVNGADAAELERVRRIVHETVPDAEEVMSYGMPGFKLSGKYLVGFCSFKDHMSLFPTSGPIAALKADLIDYKISKGTIHFTVERPLSESLIKKILRVRTIDILES